MGIAGTLSFMTHGDLLIHAAVARDVATLVLVGELDARTAPGLGPEVARLVTSGATAVNVDASLVDFVDSSGLGALVGARRRAADGGAQLVLIPSERLHRLLASTGMLGYFGLSAP